jgi:hypothetical protein
MRTKPKRFLEPALKKIKAEMAAKPVFDATSVASLDGGVTYPVVDHFARTSTTGWGSAIFSSTPTTVTSTSTTFIGTAVGSGWSSGVTGVSGTFKSTGTWWTYDELLTKEQRAIILDVICEEIIGR